MSTETATAVASPPPRLDLKQLGETSVAQYRGNQTSRREIQDRTTQRRNFCLARGIDLDKSVEFVNAGAKQQAAVAGAESKEEKFALKIATEAGKKGFTLDEFTLEAGKKGFDLSKKARQPLYRAVLALQAAKVFKHADFKRGDKIVYILASQ